MKKKSILHISHTDIRTDSRILKELESHNNSGLYDVYAIGVSTTNENPVSATDNNISILSLKLFINKSKWRPALLRHVLTMLEITVRTLIRAIKLKPDFIHCHDTLVLPIGRLLKLFNSSAKLIYDAHELESDKNGQSKSSSWLTLRAEKMCWPAVDLLVSVSPSILNWYDENLGVKPNVLVLNSPVISNYGSFSQNSSNYFQDKYEIPDQDLVFIYLGILSPGRGIESILNAFSEKEITSHVVFMGFGELESLIKRAVQSNPRIHYHEPVQHDEVVSLASSADVGLCFVENVSLSDYYCLPNKLFEYAFSGLPVLASDFPDIKAYIDKYSLGLCCELSPDSIKNAIIKCQEGSIPQVNSKISELSWSSQSKSLLGAYSKLR